MKTLVRVIGFGSFAIGLAVLVCGVGVADAHGSRRGRHHDRRWGDRDGRGGSCECRTSGGCDEDDACTKDADCSDGNGCTTDACVEGSCKRTRVAGCVPCASAKACDDHNPCTGDVCTAAGVCEHRTKADCIPCECDSDCDDHNPCSTESCGADGSCKMTFTPGCVLCEPTAGCDDGDGCTEDACMGGVCVHARQEECCEPRPEACGDHADNDCDGRVDCDDPSCTAAPECATSSEICGNCVDDDGNGLTDFEDPGCCPADATFAMKMKTGRIIPGGETSRLRLRAALARGGGMSVNPMRQDVYVQIRPEGGADVFCAHVPSSKFMGKHGDFMFWDRKAAVTSAKGLSDMRIIVRRNGTVKLKTHGRRTQIRHGREGKLQVVVGFKNATGSDRGNVCSTVMQAFRLGREGQLLAP